MADNKIQASFFQYKGTQDIMLEEFLKYLDNQGLRFDGTVTDFLNFRGVGAGSIAITNEEYIKVNANPEIIKFWNENTGGRPDRIFPGTFYWLPNVKLTTEPQKKTGAGTFLEQKDFTTFWSDYQREILEDSDYVAFDSETLLRVGIDEVRRKNLNAQVWIYSRALDSLVDISPWVMSVSTNKGMDVGSFTIDVVPTAMAIESESLNPYSEIVNQFSIVRKRRGTAQRDLVQDWFTRNIQYNDVVFIRYEVLKRESGSIRELKNSDESRSFLKSPYDLATGKMWDMIGLVDTNTMTSNFEGTDYTVRIQGRDFMKLFVEDGSYFIPLKLVEGSADAWFWGGDKNSGAYRRNMIDGEFKYLEFYEFQKIADYAGFIMNQLVNIGIVPDSLFEPVQKRTALYSVPDEKQQNSVITGIWKIVRAFFDDQLSDRRIVDPSLASPEGTLMNLFDKICQRPFVEFWGDTWGDEFDVIIRQPPFTRSAILDIYDRAAYIDIAGGDLLQLSLQYDDRAYGLYRIMPQNSFLGKSEYSSLAFVPIVMLDEYVERFGNKRCITNDIYLSCESFNGKDEELHISTFSQALINDLLFTIETTMYLPFTRKGTITINGDRRIKPGTFVRLEPTDELFYVTAVANSISFSGGSVDRVTTLTVERGMRFDNIRGSGSSRPSYFDLVDIDGLRGAMYRGIANQGVDLSANKATVNGDVFNYFLLRKFNK